MRSEFENWFKTTKFYENMIKSITTHEIKAHPFDRTGGKYKSIYVQLAFDSFKHQQSKVDELQKQKSLQELEINQIAQANQQWQLKCVELQMRLDAAQKVADKMAKGTISVSMFAYELEQALKGGGE